MSDVVLVAMIVSVAPTLAVVVTWLKQRKQIKEVHDIVNSRSDRANKLIEELRAEIRRLHRESEP